ncbi:MAG: cytochrome P450 [Verrucomicrobiota bacterium]
MPNLDDPFQEARRKCPVFSGTLDGEKMPLILRIKEIREVAKDWMKFSSDAPRRVPIPSEESVRTVRQYPLEVDPPVHMAYRKLVKPIFMRPKLPEFQEKLDALYDRLIDTAIDMDQIEVVREFAIPLQSHALTYLLNVDEKEAETWIGWGVHVFKEGDGESKGSFMEQYCQGMFEAAEKNPGEDFFSILNEAELDGRKLTMEEKLGYANIAFAGGRDTIIHTVARIISYFADHPEELRLLQDDPKRIKLAAEEFFRVFIPLTHIGRVCPVDSDVYGHEVKAGGRVSLVWSAANRDEEVFEDPNEIKLDRKPNPHVAFGYGNHICLGSQHAHAVVISLLEHFSKRVGTIEIVEKEENIEQEECYERKVGYEKLMVKFNALETACP